MIQKILHNDRIEEVEVNEIIDNSFFYEQQVVQFIREKYSLDEELAIQRQREVKIPEFETYNSYCEECKIRAKTVLNII